ncbi:hypothetical protein [Streptomyces tropicalis]|uniref:BMP family ABC transporter substrate-binding protein n=1 Tax=Streptomyces tropicalis TaxID=3034234 RepID=A0ABT6ACR6_9ACTN|nr:hypothetical protein [Streptomyces tropicalis]MDF3301625.1 hypothetical protein [Streptomyces tropicalis]
MTQARASGGAQGPGGGRLAVLGRAAVTWLRSLRGRTVALAAGATAVVAALVVAGVLFLGHDDRPPIPDTRARHYTETDACLLTGKDGITGSGAAVWQGMQDASLATHARVSWTQVSGEQSVGNARPFLNGMLQRSCDVVLAVGRPETAAASEAAPRQKKVAFVLVGGGRAGANTSTVAAGDGVRAGVAAAVERAVRERA